MSSSEATSYSHGASGVSLLGETIGANLRRIAAEHPDAEVLGGRADRTTLDVRGIRHRDGRARPRPDRRPPPGAGQSEAAP